MNSLFTPFTLRDVTTRNRIGVSPMCTYSVEDSDGHAGPWHVAHLGARAIGGAGVVMTEATAVAPEGRISPQDLGIWSDEHVDSLKPVAAAIASQGAVPAIQLAHAGRKASTFRPWDEARGRVPLHTGGWVPVGPTQAPFDPTDDPVIALDETAIERVVQSFAAAAVRAVEAGFRTVEVHGAHGYLLHSFYSPLVNAREDRWGRGPDGRELLTLSVIRAVRAAVGESIPVWLRLSASDWREDGWQLGDTVRLALAAQDAGADLIDCSSGGAVPGVPIPVGANYQVPFAQSVKEAGVPSAAVGAIIDPAQADAIVREERADLVLLGKAMLRDPHWALNAASRLGVRTPWPQQYGWAVAPSRAER